MILIVMTSDVAHLAFVRNDEVLTMLTTLSPILVIDHPVARVLLRIFRMDGREVMTVRECMNDLELRSACQIEH